MTPILYHGRRPRQVVDVGLVEPGQTFEVPDELAASLLAQPRHFSRPPAKKATKKATKKTKTGTGDATPPDEE